MDSSGFLAASVKICEDDPNHGHNFQFQVIQYQVFRDFLLIEQVAGGKMHRVVYHDRTIWLKKFNPESMIHH